MNTSAGKNGLMIVLLALVVSQAKFVMAAHTFDKDTRTVIWRAHKLITIHNKAKRALVDIARNQHYSNYFKASNPEQKQSIKKMIDMIALNIRHQSFIEEMCLVDRHGVEISRITGKEVARNLSHHETNNPLFNIAFTKAKGQVYITPIYLSHDANKWVLAYVTPIVVHGKKEAILHYEHGLDFYQNSLNSGIGGDENFVVAVNESGWVISDSRKNIKVTSTDGKTGPEHYFEQFSFAGKTLNEITKQIDRSGGVLTNEGVRYKAVYKKVIHWTLISFHKQHNGPHGPQNYNNHHH